MPNGIGRRAVSAWQVLCTHRTWAVAEKNDWQFSNPRIDTVPMYPVSALKMYWANVQLFIVHFHWHNWVGECIWAKPTLTVWYIIKRACIASCSSSMPEQTNITAVDCVSHCIRLGRASENMSENMCQSMCKKLSWFGHVSMSKGSSDARVTSRNPGWRTSRTGQVI